MGVMASKLLSWRSGFAEAVLELVLSVCMLHMVTTCLDYNAFIAL